jgi:hypothetical protein
MNEPMEEPGKKVIRLPVKQKHQLHFEETMQLNMEVRKLRKQVHKMQEQMMKCKHQTRNSKAIGVET